MSEHELRIQRSLQKLNVPEWYKNNARPSLLRRHNDPPLSVATSQQSSSFRARGGWSGLSTTASSMTSLSGYNSRSGTPTRVVIPTRVRPDWRNVKSSRESLLSPASVTSGADPLQPRWGSGRSSYSACPSPSPSTSSASTYRTSLLMQHGRQPYLGWRSQDKLNMAGTSPAPTSYATPAERLASTLQSPSVAKVRSELVTVP